MSEEGRRRAWSVTEEFREQVDEKEILSCQPRQIESPDKGRMKQASQEVSVANKSSRCRQQRQATTQVDVFPNLSSHNKDQKGARRSKHVQLGSGFGRCVEMRNAADTSSTSRTAEAEETHREI